MPRLAHSKFAGLRWFRPELTFRDMSRRSRRRGVKQADGTGWLARASIILLALCLVVAAVFYASVRSYLHSEGFRHLLSEKAGAFAKVTGEFTPFRWEGLAVETEAFQGTGKGIIRDLRVDGLHTEIGLGGLRRGVWEIRDARMRRIAVSLDATQAGASDASPSAAKQGMEFSETSEKSRGWLPKEVELQGLELGQVDLRALLDEGALTASGIRVEVKPDGGSRSFRAEASGGDIRLPYEFMPAVRLDRARLRYQDGAVFLTHLSADAWREGRLEASGEWDRDTRRFSFEGGLSGVKCEEILSETWAKRLIGTLNTDLVADNHAGKLVLHGRLVLHNGTLTALPVLDILAAYADTRRFRVLALSEAHADWRWEKDLMELCNIVIASEGLARLEGRVTIRGRELDGNLRLGLVPGTLAKIPGAETDVFTPGERGLLWAPIHLTGTLDKPREDLGDRLIAAAGLRILETLPETGEEAIKFTRTALGDHPSKTIEKGVEIIEKSGLKVREVSGILDSLLGGGHQEESKRRAEPDHDGQP